MLLVDRIDSKIGDFCVFDGRICFHSDHGLVDLKTCEIFEGVGSKINCKLQWRKTFRELKVGDTFFQYGDPYLKISDNKALNFIDKSIAGFLPQDFVTPTDFFLA